jgi:hypothetical protein
MLKRLGDLEYYPEKHLAPYEEFRSGKHLLLHPDAPFFYLVIPEYR